MIFSDLMAVNGLHRVDVPLSQSTTRRLNSVTTVTLRLRHLRHRTPSERTRTTFYERTLFVAVYTRRVRESIIGTLQ